MGYGGVSIQQHATISSSSDSNVSVSGFNTVQTDLSNLVQPDPCLLPYGGTTQASRHWPNSISPSFPSIGLQICLRRATDSNTKEKKQRDVMYCLPVGFLFFLRLLPQRHCSICDPLLKMFQRNHIDLGEKQSSAYTP